MTDLSDHPTPTPTHVRETDVLIIGAGISGIGAAYRLRERLPDTDYAILERRADLGGTWDLFRYPGIRCDSDIFTLSYLHHPWRGKDAIADGPDIQAYLRETAASTGILDHIHFNQSVVSMHWSSETQRWSVDVVDAEGQPTTWVARFVESCTGYYSYDNPYTPDIPGLADFSGTVVHPQHWPDGLDIAEKRVVVIGSGATAVTVVPACAEAGARVTMLQRSPSYVIERGKTDAFADAARKVLPARVAHRAARAKFLTEQVAWYVICKGLPTVSRRILRRLAILRTGSREIVDTHFKPTYQPWDQRLCASPGADLYREIRRGRVEMVTDTIDHVDETGIRLSSGRHLDADVIVTATGLNLEFLGGADLTVDGRPVAVNDCWAYRGVLLSGVPNLSVSIGYINLSWTLRADMTATYVARLLEHMREHGYGSVTAEIDPAERTDKPLFFIDSNYVKRALDQQPKQGRRQPWVLWQNYFADALVTKTADVTTDLHYAPAVTAADVTV